MLTVSVVIPAYNCQKYLAKAIRSAIHPAVIEIIVIDDGSTDKTAEVVSDVKQSLCEKAIARAEDSTSAHHAGVVRYVAQSNQGVSSARNRGIDEATGDLVAFLDADDWFLPQKLSRQIACFEADAALDIVQSGWQRVDEKGNLLETVSPWLSAPELTLENFLQFKPVLPSALLIRRSCLIDTKFDIDLAAAEDVDLMSRLLLKGYKAGWVKEALVNYRQHGHNAMGNSLTQARDLNKFLNKFFGQPNLPEQIRMMERSVRYQTLIWVACYLQSTGHYKETVQQLKRAWQYSPHLPAEALIYWADSFEKFNSQKPAHTFSSLLASDEWKQFVRWLLVQKR